MRLNAVVVGLGVLIAAATLTADNPKLIPWEETGGFKRVDDSPRYRAAAQRLIHHRNRFRIASASSAASADFGDVAVVADNGAIINPPRDANTFDLPLSTGVVWTPAGSGFAVAFTTTPFQPPAGPVLPLSDDDTESVALPFAFSFLGTSYTSIFVNSDGNVTLGEGDSQSAPRDAPRLIGGPPRIAPLLRDLNPEAGGSIRADVLGDRVVVTWTDVPEFGTTNANTFQVTLQSNGAVAFVYQRVDNPGSEMVVGVAEGNSEDPISEIDFTLNLPATFGAGAIFEEFGPAHGTQVDIAQLSKEFFRTHADVYDYLVVFTDFDVDLRGAFAFNAGVRNDTQGLGTPLYDQSADFGSAGELESFVMMNEIGLYWPDEAKLVDPPIQKFLFAGGAHSQLFPPGSDQFSRRARRMGTFNGSGSYTLGLNSAMSILAQEAGHRWLAFVPFVHPTTGIGPDSFDLLGRDLAHWSFFFNVRVPGTQFGGDVRASSMEGNAIIDFGGNVFGDCVKPGHTRFRTEPNELIDGYTELDQYFMGLRQAGEVGSFWYVDDPTQIGTAVSYEFFREFPALDDLGICGKRVNLTVADIQAFPGIGPRVPAVGDEIDHDASGAARPDVKTMAFILLVKQGPPNATHASAVAQVDNFRRAWPAYANGPATGGRGRFDTNLHPAIH